jgi:hypothetical protein
VFFIFENKLITMENLKEVEQLRLFMAEAVEMLEDIKQKFGLFEKQRYFKFKSALDDFNKLSNQPVLDD